MLETSSGDFFRGIFILLETSSEIFTVLETALEGFSWCWRLLLEIFTVLKTSSEYFFGGIFMVLETSSGDFHVAGDFF